jgi:tetratricopeptide (TPR) repeat protein
VRFLFVVLGLVLAPAVTHADQWVTPSPVTLTSPNGKLQVTITPAADGKSGAQATVGPKGGKGTTYKMAAPWMPVDTMLFDDGSLLALDNWHSLGHGKMATVHERDGKVRWSKTLADLIGQQEVDRAPHSVSSIWWRKQPLEWSLAKDGKSVTITTHDENQLRIDLANGVPTYVLVTNVPDDPKRLFNRARAIAHEPGHEVEAIGLLERAIAKDGEYYEAIVLLVDVLQRQKDHAKAIALLDRLSPWKTITGYNLANIHSAWAVSLSALSRDADAEKKLRAAVASAPGYTKPTIELAELLIKLKRNKDADKVMSDFVDHLLKASYLDTYALANAADFYKNRKEPKKALAIYLKGYKKTEVTNQFLYTSLAELYEQQGNLPEAIRIHEQLLAHYQKLGSSFDSYAKRTNDELVRLRAKQKP